MKWVGGDSQDAPASASGMLGNGSHAPLQTVSHILSLSLWHTSCIHLCLLAFVKVPDMARPVSSRSQDDGVVSYIFQRPQSDGNFQTFGKHQSRWLGDESIVEVRWRHCWETVKFFWQLLFFDRSSQVLPMMLPKHLLLSQLQSTASNAASLIRWVVSTTALTLYKWQYPRLDLEIYWNNSRLSFEWWQKHISYYSTLILLGMFDSSLLCTVKFINSVASVRLLSAFAFSKNGIALVAVILVSVSTLERTHHQLLFSHVGIGFECCLSPQPSHTLYIPSSLFLYILIVYRQCRLAGWQWRGGVL